MSWQLVARAATHLAKFTADTRIGDLLASFGVVTVEAQEQVHQLRRILILSVPGKTEKLVAIRSTPAVKRVLQLILHGFESECARLADAVRIRQLIVPTVIERTAQPSFRAP